MGCIFFFVFIIFILFYTFLDGLKVKVERPGLRTLTPA